MLDAQVLTACKIEQVRGSETRFVAWIYDCGVELGVCGLDTLVKHFIEFGCEGGRTACEMYHVRHVVVASCEGVFPGRGFVEGVGPVAGGVELFNRSCY